MGGSGRELLILALLTYVPLLLNAPGKVSADTKTYLYLDPGRLLDRARSMWDPHIGLGTVTHQSLGYLFPLGPYYWLMQRIGVPDWVAQRLWLGHAHVRRRCRGAVAGPHHRTAQEGGTCPLRWPTRSGRTCCSTRPASPSSSCRGPGCRG